ncbi:hypothetical protein D9M68_973740 [compost metagenome]
MPQMAAWQNTLCSYSAISAPRRSGSSRSSQRMWLGMLPGNWRCGASACAVSASAPSRSSCASVSCKLRPRAMAWAWARRFRFTTAWCAPASGKGVSSLCTPMKSTGMAWRPWCTSWK